MHATCIHTYIQSFIHVKFLHTYHTCTSYDYHACMHTYPEALMHRYIWSPCPPPLPPPRLKNTKTYTSCISPINKSVLLKLQREQPYKPIRYQISAARETPNPTLPSFPIPPIEAHTTPIAEEKETKQQGRDNPEKCYKQAHASLK